MLPMFSGLLSGGLSLAQGLFGRSDAKKAQKAQQAAWAEQERLNEKAFHLAHAEATRARDEAAGFQEWNRQAVAHTNQVNADLGRQYREENFVHLDHLVADAERAGFNPLSYLRSGAASLYSKQVNLPGYQMAMPTTFQASPLPGLPTQTWNAAPATGGVPSVGSVMAGALNDGFNAFMSESKTVDAQAFQMKLLDAQLSGIARAKAAGSRTAGTFGFVPTATSAGSSVKVQLGGVLGTEPGDRTVTSPFYARRVDPSSTDAETAEARYGEVLGTVWGAKNVFDDVFFNLTGKTAAERYRDWTLPAWSTAKSWWNNSRASGSTSFGVP